MGFLLKLLSAEAAYDDRVVFSDVCVSVAPGELWAVLGPNGAGKSSLLRACLGLLPLARGSVEYEGQALESLGHRALARRVAWVPQATDAFASFTGLELTLMGRSPHLGLWGLPGTTDVQRARASLDELGIAHLSARSAAELSGGERRLLLLARALAQEAKVLLLDEPTAFLDMRHQLRSLGAVAAHVARGGGAVAVLHDVNLAASFAHKVLLLKRGKVLAQGPTRDVLRRDILEELFETPMASGVSAEGQELFSPRPA